MGSGIPRVLGDYLLPERQQVASVKGNVLIYRSSTGKVNVNVLFSNETFWLSQKRMSELFNVTVPDIVYHLRQINDSGEVQLSAAIKKNLIPSDNCDEQGVLLYNLDAIIAVGYRVNSYEATQFRILTTSVLKEFTIKELQLLYEAILDVKFDRRNFYNKMKHLEILTQLDETVFNSPKKEAYLFKFNPDKYEELKQKGFRLEF